jgi:tRNA pseudouridine38-40 synthase
MRNIKLTIEYDGTNYVGWQRQQNGNSIQAELERAISDITKEKIVITGAGRTDSGVHARGQVANFFTESRFSEVDFYRALNGVLPFDIVIHAVEQVDLKFSARYNAKEREYKYYLSPKPTAIDHNYSWHFGYSLDLLLMNKVTEQIYGSHDFRAFCKIETNVDHFLCNVNEAKWEQENGKNVFTIRANRFLRGMVRSLVGTIVNIGRGHTDFDDFNVILQSKDRSKAGHSAPAKGLFLERVIY